MLLNGFKKYGIPAIVICIIVLFFILRKAEYFTENDQDLYAVDTGLFEHNEETKVPDEKIIVDLKGEVHHPGVYELELGSRVKDLIQKAGGFTEEADELSVNLAQKLHDEIVVIVPSSKVQEDGGILDQSSAKIRINYASKEELMQLKGIGPTKAEAIIQYREENGLFQSVEDLLEVSGIGEKTLENIEEDIQIP